ncbi:SipW-dependent-type signal peptide-containing protein [Agromyces sp. CCNWLW203]|uniref:SipW-dependent-type signal peptide-containing protein n=1 Tax=Agromyces sp. CCNWLW203 TaxID=3112842 RepID=UPI002F965ED6
MARHRGSSVRAPLSGRWRALLAGGLVLGVGATATLAAWNDAETATGTFGSSVFDTVSKNSTDATFASHDQTAATLTFAATGMSPGALFTAGLDVRTTGAGDAPALASTVGGTAVLTSAVPAGDSALTGQLEYRVAVTTTTTACSAATYAGAYVAASAVPAAVQGALSANAGNTVRFCFQIRLKTDAPNTTQSRSGTVTWAFTSTSAS